LYHPPSPVTYLLSLHDALPIFALIHTTDRPRDAFVCVLLARLTRAKCVIHAHVAYGEWMSGLLKWSLSRADALIGVSQFVAGSRSEEHTSELQSLTNLVCRLLL